MDTFQDDQIRKGFTIQEDARYFSTADRHQLFYWLYQTISLPIFATLVSFWINSALTIFAPNQREAFVIPVINCAPSVWVTVLLFIPVYFLLVFSGQKYPHWQRIDKRWGQSLVLIPFVIGILNSTTWNLGFWIVTVTITIAWGVYTLRASPLKNWFRLSILLNFLVLISYIIGLYLSPQLGSVEVFRISLVLTLVFVIFQWRTNPRFYRSSVRIFWKILTRQRVIKKYRGDAHGIDHPGQFEKILRRKKSPNGKGFFNDPITGGNWLFRLTILYTIAAFLWTEVFNTKSEAGSFISFIVIGASAFFFLLLGYYLFWVINRRPRYIVLPFNTSKDDELKSISNLVRNALMKDLQFLGWLLSVKQIESSHNTRAEDTLSFLVTSGYDHDFLYQLQDLTSLDFDAQGLNLNFSIGKFLTSILEQLASIRINGTVQKRKNNTIEIWVEMSHNNHVSSATSVIVIPENSYSDIDEITVKSTVRKLSIDLLLGLSLTKNLGSTGQSLSYFLTGLEASTNRNWWHAISNYRKAIEIEEANHNNYGIGYYHLGSALVFQGRMEEGITYLEIAEAKGPLMAETQYMLAYAKSYGNLGRLFKDHRIFNEIIHHCRRAVKINPSFPEVYHLLGSLHYKLGRTIEFHDTKTYEDKGDDERSLLKHESLLPLHFNNRFYHYKEAHKHFKKAIRFYSSSLGNVHLQAGTSKFKQQEIVRLSQELFTTIHQLGDTVRALGYFMEAELYYRDVLLLQPGHLRTMLDLIKTYCLNENWQQAETFLKEKLTQLQEGKRNADTNLYWGWMYAGGLMEEMSATIGHELFLKYRYGVEKIDDRQILILMLAFRHLDYAIHQRPRNLIRWQQNDWLQPLIGIFERLRKNNVIDEQALESKISYDNPNLIAYSSWWLGIRVDSYIFTQEKDYFYQNLNKVSEGIGQKSPLESIKEQFENHEYLSKFWKHYYLQLKLCREEIEKLLIKKDSQTFTHEFQEITDRLILGENIYKIWVEAHHDFEKLLLTKNLHHSIIERLAVDIYAELSLITVRLLASGHASEWALQIARTSSAQLWRWREFWLENEDRRKTIVRFSPLVFRFQLASLYSWEAYLSVFCELQPEIKIRQTIFNFTHPENFSPDLVSERLALANQTLGLHPLSLFAEALSLNRQNLHDQGAQILIRLIDIISIYEPFKRFLSQEPQPDNISERSVRSRLYRQERVSGRMQFEDVINTPNIYIILAQTYESIDNFDLAVENLLEAETYSPQQQLDNELLLQLSKILNDLERFDEAHSALSAALSLQSKNEFSKISYEKQLEPLILECVINTRRQQFQKSYKAGKEIAREFCPELLIDKIAHFGDHNSDQFAKEFLYVVHKLTQLHQEETEIDSILLKRQDDWERHFYDEKIIKYFLNSHSEENELVNVPLLLARIPQIFTYIKNGSNGTGYVPFKEINFLSHVRLMMGKFLREHFEDEWEENESQRLLKIIRGIILDSEDQQFWNSSSLFRFYALMYILNSALSILELLAELSNSLAYSKAELDILTDHAFFDSRFAVLIQLFLLKTTDKENEKEKYKQLRKKLAQYYDTNGWIHYRKFATLEEERESDIKPEHPDFYLVLTQAKKILERALGYDSNRAIIHYHLSRLHMTWLESLWQIYGEKPKTDIANISPEINSHLRQAFRRWRSAKDFDYVYRLHSRLNWLRKRIEDYQNGWHSRYTSIMVEVEKSDE